jgi:two-component system OmpR family sensor kinase
MRRIQGEATRMSRIVADLLSLTDLDSGGIAPTEQVDLPGLLRDVVSDVRAVQPGRPVELVASEGLVVTGDRDRILQAVTALTSNAVRHTPEEAALPHLFERFYRVDRSRSRAQGGTGLGLAIVAAIATAHGGRYGVQSAPGAGATFWLELPGGAGSGAPERNSNAPGRAPGASLG